MNELQYEAQKLGATTEDNSFKEWRLASAVLCGCVYSLLLRCSNFEDYTILPLHFYFPFGTETRIRA